MNVTDKTWEDVLKQVVLTHGTKGLFIAATIVAFIGGCMLTWLYLSKIKYKRQCNELEELKDETSKLKKALHIATENNKELQEKLNTLVAENNEIIDRRHVREAMQTDELGHALESFATSRQI